MSRWASTAGEISGEDTERSVVLDFWELQNKRRRKELNGAIQEFNQADRVHLLNQVPIDSFSEILEVYEIREYQCSFVEHFEPEKLYLNVKLPSNILALMRKRDVFYVHMIQFRNCWLVLEMTDLEGIDS